MDYIIASATVQIRLIRGLDILAGDDSLRWSCVGKSWQVMGPRFETRRSSRSDSDS